MRSTLKARSPSSTIASNSCPSADSSMSSSPCSRYNGPTEPESICFRTAAGDVSGMDQRRGASERLEDRAYDRAGEFSGHPIQRVLILAEEDGWIELGLAGLGLILLSKHEVGILPQHLVLAHVVERHSRTHLDGVS